MVVSSLEIKRRPKYTISLLNSISKKKTHKPPKAAAAKNLSSSVYVIDATCFDECFLFRFIPFDNWKTLFLIKVVVILIWDFFTRYIVAFFETRVWKEVRISPQQQCSADTKVSKQSCHILYLTNLLTYSMITFYFVTVLNFSL